jgi:hypothetical protein
LTSQRDLPLPISALRENRPGHFERIRSIFLDIGQISFLALSSPKNLRISVAWLPWRSLTARLKSGFRDEFGEIAEAFSQVMSKLQDIMRCG